MLSLPNRTLETSVSTGTGNFALAGAFLGFMPFSTAVNVGDTIHYQIVAVDSVARPTGEWEIGRGVISAAGVLRRDTVIWNHLNTTARVNFSAGTKHIAATVLSPTVYDSGEIIQFDWQEALGLDIAGAVLHFAMTTPPAGWLKANGAAVSRTTYARLFARIGTTHGPGDGGTTFNLPDARGEFLRGWDDGRALDSGRAFASMQASGNLSHTHGMNDPGHAHGVYDSGHAHSAWTDNQGQHNHAYVRAHLSGTGINALAGPVGNITDGEGATGTDNSGLHGHNVGIGGAGTGIGIYTAGTGQSLQTAGLNEARPHNLALLACVKF